MTTATTTSGIPSRRADLRLQPEGHPGVVLRRRLEWITRLGVAAACIAFGYLGARLDDHLASLALLLAPVLAGAWWCGGRTGLVLSLLGAAAWAAGLSGELPDGHSRHPAGPVLMTGLLSGGAWITSALQKSLARARRLSQIEPLTGLLNHSAFVDRLRLELQRSQRHGHALAVMYLDVDDFKKWNDTHGHLAGDELLRQIAGVLAATTRSYDATARMGGDEFAILYPEISPEHAQQAATRLRTSLQSLIAPKFNGVTFSTGLVTCQDPSTDCHAVLLAADELMYRAKRTGKNQLVSGDLAELTRSHGATADTVKV